MEENKLNETVEQTVEQNNEQQVEQKEEINVSKLTEKQAKKMLKEVLTENEALKTELNASKEEGAKYKESWYRSAADFENWIEQQIASVKKQYSAGTTIDETIFIDIEWQWSFLNTDDEKETKLGNISEQLNIQVIISQSLNQI